MKQLTPIKVLIFSALSLANFSAFAMENGDNSNKKRRISPPLPNSSKKDDKPHRISVLDTLDSKTAYLDNDDKITNLLLFLIQSSNEKAPKDLSSLPKKAIKKLKRKNIGTQMNYEKIKTLSKEQGNPDHIKITAYSDGLRWVCPNPFNTTQKAINQNRKHCLNMHILYLTLEDFKNEDNWIA